MSMNTMEARLLANREALLGYIRKKVGDPDLAEDILQDGMLKAVLSSSELRDEEKLIPWFYSIINNAIIDLFRRRQVELKYLEKAVDEVEESVQPVEVKAICGCFRKIMPTLKPEYAEVIEEIDLGGAEPEQVAERLGITRNNLKVRLHRARTQLRQKLEETCRTCAKHGCLDCWCGREQS